MSEPRSLLYDNANLIKTLANCLKVIKHLLIFVFVKKLFKVEKSNNLTNGTPASCRQRTLSVSRVKRDYSDIPISDFKVGNLYDRVCRTDYRQDAGVPDYLTLKRFRLSFQNKQIYKTYKNREIMNKAESADLILKLYDLRREETMREARSWMGSFLPETAEELMGVMMNEQTGAYFRMVIELLGYGGFIG